MLATGRGRLLAAAVILLAVGMVAATIAVIVAPYEDPPGRADAVVVLAGGGDERLREGRRLMERAAAPVLVISNGLEPWWPEANRLCRGPMPFEVVCFDPRPGRTQGEARGVARLAEERGWRSVVVVTSTYHVTRTRLLFERCLGGPVRVVGAEPETPLGLPMPLEIGHEWAAFAHAFVVERGC